MDRDELIAVTERHLSRVFRDQEIVDKILDGIRSTPVECLLPPRVMSVKGVMHQLGVSESTVLNYIKKGWLTKIDPIVAGDRVLIPVSALDRFVQEHQVSGPDL